MANQPDDNLSESEQASARADISPALAWAAERFEFDPSQRRPQPGVETLQKWLLNQGATVALDAMLGPQSLAALERAFAADEGSAVAKDRLGIKDGDAPEQQPPEPGPEPTPSPDSAPASARPVALSDSAISDISQDRLGFRPYVEAVAEFILAEQTCPPLAIAINAPWGQGKTSFMRMLESQLKRKAPETTMRVATTWFNPWKYSEPEQVWAAFVANITRCLRNHLSRQETWKFRARRLRVKFDRHADLAFGLRVIVAAIFLSLIASLAVMDWPKIRDAVLQDQKLLAAFYAAATGETSGYLWYIPVALLILLAVLFAYVTLSDKLGLNLLEYVEKTDFKDKIGTLSQFEQEMLMLREAVPADLKVIVFIDDLDRCKGKVLGEIIEALQLAEVSHTCIFIMGMDMRIVASVIERERPELAHSVGDANTMEHGSGYKFLEKIIQARLTLPAHSRQEMERLVAAAMAIEDAQATPEQAPGGPPAAEAGAAAAALPGEASAAQEQKTPGLVRRLRQGLGLEEQDERETPSDSDDVIAMARRYGSRYFDNPRRLKRFINGFRLQTYLTAAVRPEAMHIDRLARFLVLAEKWPALLDHMLKEELGSTDCLKAELGKSTSSIAQRIQQLTREDRNLLVELLAGDGGDPLEAREWRDLADWYGFGYYAGMKERALASG